MESVEREEGIMEAKAVRERVVLGEGVGEVVAKAEGLGKRQVAADTAPVAADRVPAGQGVKLVAGGVQKDPAGHRMGTPAGQ